jgi:hypothetical protein
MTRQIVIQLTSGPEMVSNSRKILPVLSVSSTESFSCMAEARTRGYKAEGVRSWRLEGRGHESDGSRFAVVQNTLNVVDIAYG